MAQSGFTDIWIRSGHLNLLSNRETECGDLPWRATTLFHITTTMKSTLFIDESGKSNLAEAENNPFILTGVILDDDEVQKVAGFFNYIKRKHNIPEHIPFHSYHTFVKTPKVNYPKNKPRC